MTRNEGSIASSFEDFLDEQESYDETSAPAVKRVLAWQLEMTMANQRISKNQMAKAMKTSRSQLDRILDPDNTRIQLDTLIKTAQVLDLAVRIDLVPRESALDEEDREEDLSDWTDD